MPVFVYPDPIPVATIRQGTSLRFKNQDLYVNANDKIVMHGACTPTLGTTIIATQWSVRDMQGNSVDTSRPELFTLGSTGLDLVLLGASQVLASDMTVWFLLLVLDHVGNNKTWAHLQYA
jgi:hypothetical protein